MDFGLTPEQTLVRDTLQEWLDRECPRPAVRQADDRGEFPAGRLRQIAGLGFCGLTVPAAHGGSGPDLLGAVLAVETLAAVYPLLAAAYAGVALCGAHTILDLGNPAQQQQFLGALAEGSLLFTYAITEPGAGAGAAATAGGPAAATPGGAPIAIPGGAPTAIPGGAPTVQTTAAPDGDGFVLNGTKAFVPLAAHADYLVTLARTGPGGGDLSFFLVPARRPGVTLRPVEQVGCRGAGLAHVDLADVWVPAADVLGGTGALGQGAGQWPAVAATEHLAAAAAGAGMARGAYGYAAAYARDRVQFGQPIISFDGVQHKLVDMALETEAARLLLYRAAWLGGRGREGALAAAMARAHAVETARKAAMQCLHILGGYGYTLEYDAQRYVRDTLSLTAGSDPAEVQKTAIGALLGLGPEGGRP